MAKEEYAIVLEYLPHGYPLEKKMIPLAQAIGETNLTLLELIPGLGKKHMQEILKQRKEKEFKSFEDMKKRVQNLPDPEKAIEKRIFQELTVFERYNLFIK